jgi:hypothetical protein
MSTFGFSHLNEINLVNFLLKTIGLFNQRYFVHCPHYDSNFNQINQHQNHLM